MQIFTHLIFISIFSFATLNGQLEAQSRPFRAEQAELSIPRGKELAARYRSGESPPLTEEFFKAGETRDPWKGDEYAVHSDSQEESAHEFINGISLQNTTAVLDVGCGDGKVTAAIANALPEGEVIGVDVSSSMIDFAKTTFSDYANLQFFVQHAAMLDFYEQFDLITSFTVMQWVIEQDLALKCFEKALKPGGRLCIQMPTGLPSAMEHALEQTLNSEKWAGYFREFSPPWRFYQPEEYRELLLSAHLFPDRIETASKHEHFPSRAVFQGFLKQWFPYLRALQDNLKDDFLTEIVDRYLEILPPNQAGEISFIVTRLEVEAKKQ